MNEAELLDHALEAALQLHVARRCERAYVHDLRGALQPIQASVEVLLKSAERKSPSVTAEKVTTIVRNTMASLQRTLERTVKYLVLSDEESTVINAGESVRECAQFLDNDATAHGVEFESGRLESLSIHVRPARFRLTVLGMTIRAIDSMPHGGRLAIGVQGDAGFAVIEWRLQSAVKSDDWLWRTLKKVAVQEGGAIDSAEADHIVRLRYPTASSDG